MTTNLSVETRYKLKAFATNTVGTGYGSLVNFWTLSAEPLTHSTTFTNSVISQTQINLSFDAASTITNADGYIILQKTGSAPTGTPTDGNAYSVGNTIVDATVAAIITNPASISTSITGLTAGTHYYFTIMPYNYNGSNNETYNYKTDGSVPGTNGTTSPPNDADSYVSAPTTQANPVTISSLADTDPESVEVFKFKINDVGTDGLMTKVTQVSISAGTNNNAVWSSTIQGAKLSIDGGSTFVTTGSATIGTSSVVFPISVGNLNITNGSNATVSLFIYLKSSGLTDKQVLEFNIPTTSHGFTADATGSTFLTTFATATTSNQISIDVTGTKFNFATQPSNTTVNTNFSTAVEAVDANNNRDLEATTSVTLGASAGTLSSVTGLTKSLVAGLFSWTDLQNNTAGTGVTLSATGTLTTANSNSFRILSAIPTTQASAIVFSNVGMTTMTVSWTNGNGANRILVGKATGTPGTPTNGTSYTASTVFGSGGTFGANEYVLYNGFGSTVDITGLTGSTTYTFKVFEFNGSSGTENYITTSNATSQATTGLTYYSNGSGDPATLTNWKTNRDGTGTSPANFVSGETFTIESPDNMTTTATWAISGTNSKLHIENGGTLTANHAITLTAATTFQIDNLGTYIHNNISAFGTTIFQGTESFASNSTVEFKDWNSTGPSVSAWGNVKFNATGAVAGSMQLSGNMTVINGNLEIIATGSTPRDIRFATTQAPTITISGYFTQNAGTVNLATTSGITVFNVAGNFAVNGGTFTSTSTGSKVVFNGSGVQNFMNAGTISIVNFEVGSTSTLNMGTQVLPGGSFTLPSGATLKTAHTSGINGSITSPAPALNTGANYDFNGASSQVTGALLPATINNLTIDNAAGVTLSNAALTVSGTMTINSGKLFTLGSSKQLTVSGALTNSATESGLVIESGGSLIHNSANVPATVKREIPKDNTWHFLSSPVSAQAICDGNYAPTTGNFTDIIGATYDFFKWSEPTVAESKNWLNLKNTDWTLNTTDFGATPQFTPKTGYLVAYNGTFAGSATKSFAGSLNTGDQSFALTTGGNTWNLIGNPFPSAIDWDAVTKTVLADGYYNIYNEAKSGGAGYESYLDVTHKTAGANGKIAATQGFFVKAASTPLDIPNTARVHDNNWLKSSESNPVNQLKLKLGNAVNYDEALIIFEANGSLNKGWYDASKLFSMNVEVPQVYTMKDNGRICINSLPATNDPITVPVGMLIPSDGNYTLDLSGIESFSSRPGIILEDLKTNTTQNMVQTPVYSFSASKTDDPKRFLLHFALAIGINDKTTSQPFHVIASDNSLFIVDNTGNNKGEVSIYNMMGQLILRKPLSENPLTRLNFDGVTGYYIVKVITQNNLFTCKVFFN
ncbi:MAG: T9SS type A sorting domain-containing protein [Bacteroidetes bacterium]|nr:T9SS type A sorting domain-containing protein [Bacteroidota bacterium]